MNEVKKITAEESIRDGIILVIFLPNNKSVPNTSPTQAVLELVRMVVRAILDVNIKLEMI